MFLFWGNELIQLYNDGYLPSFGTGKHPRAMGQRGADCWQEIWPLIEPQIADAMQRRIASWNEDQLVPIFRDGRIEEVYWTYGYSPVLDDDGNAGGVLVVCTETTKQVLATRRADTLRSLASALESARADGDGLLLAVAAALSQVDRDVPFAVIHCDDGVQHLVGLDEAAALKLVAAMGGPTESAWIALLSPVAAGPWVEPVSAVFTMPLDRAAGDIITFGLSARLPFDDSYRAFLEQIGQQIIGARNRALLDSARDRVAEVLESTQDSFFALDSHFQITFVNRNQERTSGVTRANSVGRYFFDVFPVPTDGKYWTEYHRAVSERVAVHFEEYYAPLDLWTEVRGSPTSDGGLAVFYRDISARKKLETERENLLTREREFRKEAEAARGQAESANRMKDEFLSTVSHELRTPLNAMLGWSTLLRAGTLDAGQSARALETIERNARTQTRLIDDLLDLARILQGKFRLSVGPVDLAKAVESALDAVRLSAEAKGVSIQPALDLTATLVGDAERLQQVAWNLLSNAIKFTPKGGRVTVRLARAASDLELTVSDTGQGLEAELLPHVFEPFKQADATITRRSGGLGLGLSIVRTLVEMHGGTVAIKSPGIGQGAEVTVRLPVSPAEADLPQEPTSSRGERTDARVDSPAPLDGVRALVVDDEHDTRELIAFLLDQAGATVTASSCAGEAFAELERARFDVIVSDIGMPDEDGFTFIRRVRRLSVERGGRTPAVALTAYARREDRARALRAGFDTHLAKPIEPAELLVVLGALVEGRR